MCSLRRHYPGQVMRVNAGGRTAHGLGVLSAWLPKLPVHVFILQKSV